MRLAATTVSALRELGLDLKLDHPLALRTWWRVGGPADGYAVADTVDQVAGVQRLAEREGFPVFVLGNGSNLLVSDLGVRGLVLQLGGDLARVQPAEDPTLLHVGGGLKLARFVQQAVTHSWTGMEVFAGIPGTIGGAIRMNAGASLGETSDVLVDATVVRRGGASATLSHGDLAFGYRTAQVPDHAVVVSATLRLRDADPVTTFAQMQRFLERRKATQPTDVPTCGSTFRNPPGDFAGRLVEAAGLKGFRVGGAQVSLRHANFVENQGGATADELREVIEHMRATVARDFGVSLVPEVHLAGDWSHWHAAADGRFRPSKRP